VGEPTTDCKNIKNARYGILTEALMKGFFYFIFLSWYIGTGILEELVVSIIRVIQELFSTLFGLP
jgi:hypothetical protein